MLIWEQKILTFLKYFLPITFFLPLVTHSSYFFPFIVPKNTLFRIIVFFAFGLFAMLIVIKPKKYLPQKNPIIYSLVALLGVLTLSSIINGDFLYAFWSTYERMEGLINLYTVFFFILMLAGVYRTKEDWLYLFRFTVLLSFPITFLGLAQHVGVDLWIVSAGGERVSSTLGNATYLAAYAMFHIFFILYLLYKVKAKESFKFEFFGLIILDIFLVLTQSQTEILSTIFSNGILSVTFILPQLLIAGAYFLKEERIKLVFVRMYFVLLAALNFYVLFNTQTRGALVGLIGGLFLILIGVLVLQSNRPQLKRYAAGGLLIMVLVIGTLFANKDSEFVTSRKPIKRVASISLNDNTATSRFLNWEAAYLGWKEKPILGWGEESYYEIFNKYFPEEIYRHGGSRVWFDRPHNVIIQYFVGGGLLGGFAYLAIFASALWALFIYWRRSKDLSAPLLFTGLLAGYVVQNIFVFDSLNSYLFFSLVLAYILFLSRLPNEAGGVFRFFHFFLFKNKERKVFDNVDHDGDGSLFKKPPYFIFVLVFVIGYLLTIPQAATNRGYIQAIIGFNQDLQSGSLNQERLGELKKVINANYLGKFELRQNFADQIQDKIITMEGDDAKRMLIDLAEEMLLDSIEEQPDNARHYVFLANLYATATSFDPSYGEKNIPLLKKAIELSPTRAHFYYTLGRTQFVLGQPEASVISYARGVELAPKVSDAHVNYINILISTSNFEDAHVAISDMKEKLKRNLSVNEYKRVLSAYKSVQNRDGLIRYSEEAVEVYPEDIESLQRLIAVYLADKKDAEALELAKRVAELDETYKDPYEDLKDELGL